MDISIIGSLPNTPCVDIALTKTFKVYKSSTYTNCYGVLAILTQRWLTFTHKLPTLHDIISTICILQSKLWVRKLISSKTNTDIWDFRAGDRGQVQRGSDISKNKVDTSRNTTVQ